MSMRKVAACWAALIALVAFAAAPGAAWAGELYSGGTKLPIGTGIVGTDPGESAFVNSLFTTTCGGSQLSGNVYSQEKVSKISVTNITFSNCTTPGGGVTTVNLSTPLCLSALGDGSSWSLLGAKCSSLSSATIVLTINLESHTCQYSREGINFSRSATEPLSIYALSGEQFKKISGPFSCGGPTEIGRLEYQLKTASGGNIQVK
jgi:hypothetical protein